MARRDDDLLAAEFVLGTLTGPERVAAKQRHREDTAFRSLVSAWERRLSPLAEAIPETAPPQGLWRRIEAALPAPATRQGSVRKAIDSTLAALERQLAAWRVGALASGAAAALALGLWLGGIDPPGRAPAPNGDRYVAMLMGDARNYGFVVTVEPASHKMMVRRLAPHPPGDQTYELWLLKDNSEPKTLGVVAPGEFVSMPMPDNMDMPEPNKRIKLAISLEQRGGAGGRPMGRVMYAGDLMKLTP